MTADGRRGGRRPARRQRHEPCASRGPVSRCDRLAPDLRQPAQEPRQPARDGAPSGGGGGRARRRRQAACGRPRLRGAPGGARLRAAPVGAGRRRAGAVRDGGHADRQRWHRHHCGQRRAADRAGCARSQPEAAGQRLAATRPAHAGRALPGARGRCLARVADFRQLAAPNRIEAGRQGAIRPRGHATLARFELPRRGLRLHQRAAGGRRRPGESLHRLHARHQTRTHRSARATCAGHLAARTGGQRVERRQHRPAHRPHAVQPAGARGDGALSWRHQRNGDRARARNGGDSVGTARHQPGCAVGRPAAVGDPQQAAAQAAHRGVPRHTSSMRVRTTTCW